MKWLSRLLFELLTFILHPLWALVSFWLIFYSFNPYAFGSNNFSETSFQVISIRLLASTIVLPGLAILMIKKLGLIDNLKMEGIKERILPIVIVGLFYFWMFLNIKKIGDFPQYFQIAVLGFCFSILLSFFVSIFERLNIYAVSTSSILVAFLTADVGPHRHYFFIEGHAVFPFHWLIGTFIIMIGAYLSMRMFRGYNSPKETLMGIGVGLLGQFISTAMPILH